MRLLAWLLLGCIAPLFVGCAALGVVFFTQALTWQGLVAGGVLVSVAVLPGVEIALRRFVRAPALRRVMWVSPVAVVLVGMLALAIASPDGRGVPGSPYRSVRPASAHFDRFSLWNLVPEIDLVRVGATLVPAVDPVLTREGADRLKAQLTPIYQQLQADPQLVALGSALPDAIAELRRGDWNSGHLFAYVPERTTAEKPCALVFLHGSAGAFKFYLWSIRQLADRLSCIAVLPTFGFGNWWREEGVAVVEHARRWAIAEGGADPKRLYLVGLSNGGLGVGLAGAELASEFAGLAFVSAVIDEDVVSSEAFLEGWKDRPVLVVHGTADDRVSEAHARQAVSLMSEPEGASVRAHFYEGADHFLLLSDRERFEMDFAAWVTNPPPPPPAAGAEEAPGLHEEVEVEEE